MRGSRQASHRSRRRWRSSKLRNCKDCRREGCRRYRLSSHVGRFEQASQRPLHENDGRRSNCDEVSNELHFRKFGAALFNRGRATIHQPMHKTAGHRTSIKKCTCRGGPDRRIFPNVTGGGRSMHFPFCSHLERPPSFPPSWIADCSKVLIIEKILACRIRVLSRLMRDRQAIRFRRRLRRRPRPHSGGFTLSGRSFRTTLSNEL